MANDGSVRLVSWLVLTWCLVFLPGFVPVGAGSAPTGGAASALRFDTTTHDFGRCWAGDVREHRFTFRNTGPDVVQLVDLTRSCGCTAVTSDKGRLEPGQSGWIDVRFDSHHAIGAQHRGVHIQTDEPGAVPISVWMDGHVDVALAAERRSVHARVEHADGPFRTTVNISKLRPVDDLRVETEGPGLTARVASEDAESAVIELVMAPGGKPGARRAELTVRARDHASGDEVRVSVPAYVIFQADRSSVTDASR